MSKIPIITGEDNHILRTKSEKVSSFNSDLKKLVKKLKKALIEHNGLGIAAPQIGINERVVLITLNHGSDRPIILPMINPEIVEFSNESEVAEEGCLSLPGIFKDVERAKHIKIKFKDIEGTSLMLSLSDLNAREAQHEVDHLDGILFTDRVNSKKLNKIL
ncbi:peptide deformylase [Candidatus Peregrinibacteria bacterium]|nr:peptide deformylase [Candidatus Peregrinibacteria bacterium]